jgi:Fic family protein
VPVLDKLLTDVDALKVRFDALEPIPDLTLQTLRADREITHTYHSNAIEGNTLTLGETKAILLDGITISGKPLREHLEVVNHREAMRLMERLAALDKHLEISEILNIHQVILTGIQSESAEVFRSVRVRVLGSEHVFPNPLKIPELMQDFVDNLNTFKGHEGIKAANAHYNFVAIHPFIDGNSRTARLLMNLLLIRAGYPPALLPVTLRAKYYDALEFANKGDLAAFEILIAEVVNVSLQNVIDLLEP